MIGLMRPYEDPDYPESLGLETPADLIEFAGRWDYGPNSVAKMQLVEDHDDVIRRWLEQGEESMVEMGDAIFLVTCTRVVSHEMVRHHIASYQQESQRFVKYSEEPVTELMWVPPEIIKAGIGAQRTYASLMAHSLEAYNDLREIDGVSAQIARYVLPNATRTRIIVKMNLRELRHVLQLRMHTSAQPEFQVIAREVHRKLQREFGTVLVPDDLAAERGTR